MEDKNKATQLSDQELEQAAGGRQAYGFLSADGKPALKTQSSPKQAAVNSRSGTYFSVEKELQEK